MQSKSKGLRTRRTKGVNPSPKAGELENQEELMFRSELKGQKRPMSQLNSQAGGVAYDSSFLFYSGLQLIG